MVAVEGGGNVIYRGWRIPLYQGQVEALPGCFGVCPHLETVQGSCDHDLRPLIVSYLRENPDAPCPVYEEIRAQEMRDLADRLESR